jgi:hypothetical protein
VQLGILLDKGFEILAENFDDQTVAHWRIDVDCDARLRRGQDGFGNAVTSPCASLVSTSPVAVIVTVSGAPST